ncbi:MAG: GNAT family N-acetyltransferase [Ruminococcaceae bacterium]|nr:GNAT family N-acetyltransferase [Oscillospiraceae bacterium]
MEIKLMTRTEETVKIYFEKAQDPFIKAMLPQKAQSVKEALADYRETLLPSATSYGRTIWADGQYVGDVWCYCIDSAEEPNAMLSYCIFNCSYRNKGIATKAVSSFLQEIYRKFKLQSIGAFTFSENLASIRVLEKVGFSFIENFTEDGKESKYYQLTFQQ